MCSSIRLLVYEIWNNKDTLVACQEHPLEIKLGQPNLDAKVTSMTKSNAQYK
jgi:hypothetical protein